MAAADFLIKVYTVSVDGYAPATFYASSPGKARAAAWRAFPYVVTFREFIRRASVRRGLEPRGFGRQIFVAGAPAFFVTRNGPSGNIGFVRPGAEVLMWSHPLDCGGEGWIGL